MYFRAGGTSAAVGEGEDSFFTAGGASKGRVQSGSDLESFNAVSVVDTVPCLISKLSK